MTEGDGAGGEDKKSTAPAVSTADREHSKQTFLSSLDLESTRPARRERRPEKNKFRSLSEASAGPRIMEHHGDLQDLARTLDQRMRRKLDEHKKEFFLAYKTHMYTVQSDIRTMRMKADHEEAKTREDARIRALEGELEWFMTEALRLDEYCKGYKKEVDKWRAKAEALDEDRQFLEDQIKGAKRQNKVLRAAAERARSSAYSALRVTRARTEEPPEAEAPGPARPASAGAPRGRSQPQRSRTPELGLGARGRGGYPPLALPPSVSASASVASLPRAEDEVWYVEHINTLKRSILREQHTVRMLQAARATQYTRKSEFEELFLRCIDEARKDLARRRHVIPEEQKGERQRMLEQLLTNEDVLVSLYEKLFPHRTGVARSLGGGAGDDEARLLSALPLEQLEAQFGGHDDAHFGPGCGHMH